MVVSTSTKVQNSLVSHGASGQECYGSYNSTTETGWGPAYINSCIHSDSNEYSGGNTVWYDYTLATAGTIVNKDATDTTGNLNTATESVCPKGWTLPSKTQIDNQRNVASFSPVLGGNYGNGTLFNEATRGVWWGSEAYNGATRYNLYYNGSSLYTSYGGRSGGFYIRCVSEEKTVLDLTYMQDNLS